MTAIFKVVEFYRFNNSTATNNINTNAALNNSTQLNTTENDAANCDDQSSASTDCLNSNKKTFPSTLSSSSISSNGSNSIYNTLGFNVLGGYSTDFPATIIDVAAPVNGKSLKVIKISKLKQIFQTDDNY